MTSVLSRKRALLLFTLFLLPLSCLPGQKRTAVLTVAPLVEEVGKASARQSDPQMVREGMPAYLMLLDGMIEVFPDNERLLIGAAQAYASFASLFVADQDPEYAKYLYGRGKDYALRALERKGMKDPLGKKPDAFRDGLGRFSKREVPYLFWTATCWASWINLSQDSMEAMAQLPKVEWMMKRVLELDEGFSYGGPHLFMGIWLASRPKIAGGDLKKAQEHFLKAIDLGRGRFLMAYVYYADFFARRALDKELFVATLQKVVDAPLEDASELTLSNAVAKKKAKELLSRAEEYFE